MRTAWLGPPASGLKRSDNVENTHWTGPGYLPMPKSFWSPWPAPASDRECPLRSSIDRFVREPGVPSRRWSPGSPGFCAERSVRPSTSPAGKTAPSTPSVIRSRLAANLIGDDDGPAGVHHLVHDQAPGLVTRRQHEDGREIEEPRQLGLIAEAAEANAVEAGRRAAFSSDERSSPSPTITR